jgi:cell division topological specificity factor
MINKWFQKFSTRDKSKEVAKKRLKFALIYDKLEVSDEMLQNLQSDIVSVISRYFEIDQDALTLDIHQENDLSALVFNTPILSARRRHDA